jgi:uncharacterized protein
MTAKAQRAPDATVEARGAVYAAVDSGDVAKLRAAVRKAPAVLEGGWSGTGGATFLHLAAAKGRTEIVAALVDAGMDIDVPESNAQGTPLESAAENGQLATVKWLLGNGARVDGRPDSVSTPLIGAAVGGHLEIARALLDAGADVNREHLRFPETALDAAEVNRVRNTGQDAVAALLRERGAIRPYADNHDWSKIAGREYIQYIEHVVGAVSPIALSVDAGRGRTLTLRRAIVAPKAEHKLLFTVGLSRIAGTELAIPLPWRWPLNRDSLELARFNWPVGVLGGLSGLGGGKTKLAHGTIVDAKDAGLNDTGAPPAILQWLLVNHASTDAEREDEPPTLVVLPVVGKKPIAAAAARAQADKKASAKWKALAVPLELSAATAE